MLSGNKTLFRTNSFEFKNKHLLVLLVLGIAFTSAFIMRSYPIKYGFSLNEFDPFFDYRATKYIVDNGIEAYLNWHDTKSWYPDGRDVPTSSQVGLHISTAILYKIFGFGSSLLDFVIMFPVIIGSLTTIAMFALVRTLSSTTAGLFASLLIAFTPSIIQRGNLGWFKSEPFGIFLGILATYLLISAIKNKKASITILKVVGAGLLLGLATASWGGMQYFSIPITIFFFVLPFVRKDIKIPLYAVIIFTFITLLAAGSFPRPGLSFVFGLPGIALILGTIFFVTASIVKIKSSQATANRNMIVALGILIILASSIIITGAYQSPSFRYMNALNPFLSSQNQLVKSVAEHFTPTLVDYFTDYAVLLLFAGFAVWMLFKRRDEKSVLVLIIGLTGIYVSATFARLMVFSSISIIMLASIGLYEISRTIMERKEMSLSSTTAKKGHRSTKTNIASKQIEQQAPKTRTKSIIKIVCVGLIIFLVSIPALDYEGILLPFGYNWISSADVPTSIANGGTGYRMKVSDWSNALEWMSKNIPDNAVVASWWDYGYWITTLGNKTSIADNATINTTRIQTIAKMFMSDEQTGIKIAQDLKSDYILLYVVSTRYSGSGLNMTSFYTLGNGGDESKKQWFIRIGGFQEDKYLEQDGFTPTKLFWNSTLLGKLIPYSPISYASTQNGALTNLQPEYEPGSIGIFAKDIKYPKDENGSQPLELVYSSESFNSQQSGPVFAVLIYKINHDYIPQPPQISETTKSSLTSNNDKIKLNDSSSQQMANIKADMSTGNEIAEINTTQGIIKVEFFSKAAPNHVKSFIELAKQGFYDNTVFHRIVKDFVIQGGDPLTKDITKKDRWGTGGPNKTINAEFNDIPHKKGILSMARTSDPNSAGSQFFIVTKDSFFLDNQYTVFGRVIEGMDVVDKIAAIATNPGNDQPIDPEQAKINSIRIVTK